MASKIVTAPLVIAHTPAGDVYVYQGGELPRDTDSDQVQALADSGMVGAAGSADADEAKRGSYNPFQDSDESPDGPSDDSSDESGDSAPAQSANKDEWVAYATSQGMPADEANGSTKQQLVDKYGG